MTGETTVPGSRAYVRSYASLFIFDSRKLNNEGRMDNTIAGNVMLKNALTDHRCPVGGPRVSLSKQDRGFRVFDKVERKIRLRGFASSKISGTTSEVYLATSEA